MRDSEFFLMKYSPITTRFAFIEMPFDELVEVCYERDVYVSEKWSPGFKVFKENCDGSFEKKLNALLPLVRPVPIKTLISETKSQWCYFTMNHAGSGGGVSSEPDYLAEILGLRVIKIVLVKDVRAGQPGSVQFSIEDWSTGKSVHRVLAAHKESRWEWDEYGEPLPFEEFEKYKEKKIKDRLTVEMVERYCTNFGIDLLNPDFYSGRGCIIHSQIPPVTQYVDKYPNQ